MREVAALIRWAGIEAALAGISAAPGGEPGWPPPALFRAVPPGTWHDPSDGKLAEAPEERAGSRGTRGGRP